MCKLSFIHLVNENSSILSLMLLFSHIFSTNCVYHFLARYIMSRFNTFTWYHIWWIYRKNTHQILFVGTEDWRQWKNGISKRIHSYTIQFICMEGEDDNSSSRQRIIQVNHEHRDRTHISHRKIQVSKSNGWSVWNYLQSHFSWTPLSHILL